jgi:molybdate transport system regulatory protein
MSPGLQTTTPGKTPEDEPSRNGAELPFDDGACLDTAQLVQLERSFRHWAGASRRQDIRLARRRILLIFLLIRHTGAKLNEILRLDPFTDIDTQSVCIHDPTSPEPCTRRISIAETFSQEIRATLDDPNFRSSLTKLFAVDPAFVRRKFYECAEACGLPKRLSGPEMIRRARAVELVRGNMPLPAVQQLLGHSTPNLTTAHVSFSDEELRQMAKLFIERESSRKTSARNAFFGKIIEIRRGDIQARVTLMNPSGHRIASIITSESLDRLGLHLGRLITAEVKAPWILLQQGPAPVGCSADNRLRGEIIRINRGKVSSEYVLRIDSGTELCALISTKHDTVKSLTVGEKVWALFNAFAVILHADD